MANNSYDWRTMLMWLAKLESSVPVTTFGNNSRLKEKVDEWLYATNARQLSKDVLQTITRDDRNWTLDMPTERTVFVLPQPRRGAPLIPVVSVQAQAANGEILNARILVGLFVLSTARPVSASDGLDPSAQSDLFSLGYRLECPRQRPPEEARRSHEFFHVQHIGKSKFVGVAPFPTPDWIPETQPSIPLPAMSRADLLTCAILLVDGGESLDFLESTDGAPGITDAVLKRAGADFVVLP